MLETIFKNNSQLKQKTLRLLKGIEFNSFALGVRCKEQERSQIRKSLQPKLIKDIAAKTGKPIDFNSPQAFILIDLLKKKIRVQLKPVYIKGRYNKFERNLAQTVHYCFKCKGKGCGECAFAGKTRIASVQEIISEKALKAFQANEAKFHGQGREDIDVLMLGNGRPFVLELREPKKRKADLKSLEKEISEDKRVKVRGLSYCEKKRDSENQSRKAKQALLRHSRMQGKGFRRGHKKIKGKKVDGIAKNTQKSARQERGA